MNASQAIMTCGDKVLTYSALSSRGIPIPKSFLALGRGAAIKAHKAFGGRAVDKPPLGSWGRMVSLVTSVEVADQIARAREMMPSSVRGHIVQEYVETEGRDVRCLVLGGKLLGCVERIASSGWRSNVALGSTVRPMRPSSMVEDLSIRAADAVGGEFVAVDLLGDSEVLVNEVNGIPEFKGFMKATGVDVPRELALYLKGVLRA